MVGASAAKAMIVGCAYVRATQTGVARTAWCSAQRDIRNQEVGSGEQVTLVVEAVPVFIRGGVIAAELW